MLGFLGLFNSVGADLRISPSHFGGSSEHKREDTVREQLLRTACEAFWPLHVLNIRVMEKEDKTAVNAHTFIFLAYLC